MAKDKGNSVQDVVIGTDSNDFFDQLESSVNSGIVDEVKEATPTEPEQTLTSEPVEEDPQQESKNIWEDDSNPYKKRYADSSREGVKLNDKLKDLSQYESLINVMKNDVGAVEAMRNYLKGEQQPTTVKERLGIDDDFVFDPDEAFADGGSKSAKLFNAHVDNIVQQRVSQAVQGYQAETAQQQETANAEAQFNNFVKEKGYSPEEARALQEAAAEHTLSWEDIDYLLNRDKVKNNIAQSTKKQMMNQIEKAQSVPKTASRSGSADGGDISHEDAVFSAIKGMDETLDNLF
tara:strand:+ start:1663 stop:2535 length:873 start_codon:yes stop_codon:yes gene_type:complete